MVVRINTRDTVEFFNAELMKVDFLDTERTNEVDWRDGSASPIYRRQSLQFTPAEFTFLVEGDDYNDLQENISELTASMSQIGEVLTPFDMDFDDFDFIFRGFLEEKEIKKLNPQNAEVVFTCRGQRLGELQTVTFQSHTDVVIREANLTRFNVECTAQFVPCKIRITKSGFWSAQQIRIYLNSIADAHRWTLDIPTTQGDIIIDGERGLIERHYNYVNYNLGDKLTPHKFPTLINGTNTMYVYAGTDTFNVEVSYRGRWV